jgi:hypothetical protein
VFISKATPEDDDFVLWLAPRLEAAGYIVFADILSIDPGDRWRREITGTLQNKAVKMLLCCRDATLDKTGVQEEIGIASDLMTASLRKPMPRERLYAMDTSMAWEPNCHYRRRHSGRPSTSQIQAKY